MEVRHKRPALRTELYQLVRQQVRLQGADPESADALHAVERLHQVNEALTSSLAEVADIHARQHDLLAPLAGSLLSLCHQRSDSRITREPARVRDSTIGTEIVAAILNLQEIASTVTTRARWRKRLDILCLLRKEALLPVTRPSLREILDQPSLLVRPQHEVHALDAAHVFRLQLGITTSDHHKSPGMIPHHPVDSLTTLPVGHFRHRTSIDQTDVSLLPLLRRHDTILLKHLRESRCF